MTTTTVTKENAPRDLEELVKLGRYKQRKLAEELGMLDNNDEKTSFMSLDNDQIADALLAKLTELDGGKKTKATTTTRTPVTKATNGAGKPTTRTPAAAEASSAGAVSGGAAVLEKMEEILAALQANTESVEALRSEVDVVRRVSAGNTRLSNIALSLNLVLAEQVLQDQPGTVLTDAINRMPDFEEIITEAMGEVADEGNE